jgi:tRNA (guanine37-N1)-methyltransferase
LTFDVVTVFPGMFEGPLAYGMLARARKSGRVGVRVHDLRRWGVGRHRQVDDATYGGGGGMVLRPEPLFDAVDWIRECYPAAPERVLLLSPQGSRLGHGVAGRLAGYERLILLCGRYEGVDERVREALADEEISIGDVVVTGGELPSLVVMDAVSRFVPGVLGRSEAAERDSFSGGMLDFPHYTRPTVFRGLGVPDVLLSGDHAEVASWRAARAADATRTKRPDLVREQPTGTAPEGRERGSS